jgi:hypothetical protein
MRPKVALVSFFTEGTPFDKGKNLSDVAKSIKEQYQDLFDYTIILSPSLLEQQDKRWKNVICNQEFIDEHLNSTQRQSSINIPWINLNSLLWKPTILMALLAENSELEEDTIIVYHDINAFRYPIYSNNFPRLSSFFADNMRGHSIALLADCLFPLFFDCKQEVLRNYLHCEGQTLLHRWGGCIAMKKNKYSRQFCRDWYNLTARDENRNQITKYENYPGFIWHSQEQSTLSVIYYLWKYRLLKSHHIKTIFTHTYREIPEKSSPTNQINLAIEGIKYHAKNYFMKSISERLMIALKGKIPSETINGNAGGIPSIRINHCP